MGRVRVWSRGRGRGIFQDNSRNFRESFGCQIALGPSIVIMFCFLKQKVGSYRCRSFTIGLKEHNPDPMLNPPFQYLRKCNFHVFTQVLPSYYRNSYVRRNLLFLLLKLLKLDGTTTRRSYIVEILFLTAKKRSVPTHG